MKEEEKKYRLATPEEVKEIYGWGIPPFILCVEEEDKPPRG